MIKIITKFVKVSRPVFLLIFNFWWILETMNCVCLNRVKFSLFKAVINFSLDWNFCLVSQAKISAWFSEQIFSNTTLVCDFILFSLNFEPACHKLDWQFQHGQISTWAFAPGSVECETPFQFHSIPNLAAVMKLNM